jgi:hypothetical protein
MPGFEQRPYGTGGKRGTTSTSAIISLSLEQLFVDGVNNIGLRQHIGYGISNTLDNGIKTIIHNSSLLAHHILFLQMEYIEILNM